MSIDTYIAKNPIACVEAKKAGGYEFDDEKRLAPCGEPAFADERPSEEHAHNVSRVLSTSRASARHGNLPARRRPLRITRCASK